MCGRATLTMVASRITISCAVAITSRARPGCRLPAELDVGFVAVNVVAMAPMVVAGRPAVVGRRNRLLADQRAGGRPPGYSAGSSRQSLPLAGAPGRPPRVRFRTWALSAAGGTTKTAA